MEKQCARCGETKPLDLFYAHKGWADGRHPYCKACFLAYSKARREKLAVHAPGYYRWKRDLVRHDYFDQIDHPMKAYILGFLAADGNVLPKHHRITLELSVKDADLLARIRDELVPGGAITQRQRRGFTYQTLAFVSRQMITALGNLGVGAAKSRTLLWPTTLPEEFSREFILGYFDGDGFITYHQRGAIRYPYIGFTSGSRDFLLAIADGVERYVGIRPQGPWLKAGSNAYMIRASGRRALAIDQWLHSDDLGLQRKRLERSYGTPR